MYDSRRTGGYGARGAPAARGATGGSPQDGAASRRARLGTVGAQNLEPLPEVRRPSNWVRPAPRRRFPPTASFARRAGAHAWVHRAETRRFQEGRAGTHCAGAVRRLLCPTPLPAPGAAPPSASVAPSLILRRGARGGQPAQRASGLPSSRPPADNVFSFLFMLGFFLFILICFFSPFFL